MSPGDTTADGRVRKRQVGGGRKGPLSTRGQELLCSLGDQKTSPRQALGGEVFGLSPSRAKRGIPRVLPILKQALAEVGVLPPRAPGHFAGQGRRPQETGELIIDGTARRRPRPTPQAKQALPSSGKQKTPRDKAGGVVPAQTQRVG